MDYASEAVVRLQEMSDQCGSGALSEINRHSSGEFFLLKILSLYDGPVHPSELQRRSCTSSARVTAILSALQKKGWVAREIDEQDRRRVLVSLTEEGNERAQHAMEEMTAKLEAVFHELGEHDTDEFVRILARLLEIFNQLKDAQFNHPAPSGHCPESCRPVLAENSPSDCFPRRSNPSEGGELASCE